MWRAVFLALGVSLILIGVECFMFDQVEIKKLRPESQSQSASQPSFPFSTASFRSSSTDSNTRIIQIKDWMPWSILAIGSVVLIYTFTIPRRKSE